MAIQFMDNFNMYGLSGSALFDGTPWNLFYGTLANDPDPGADGDCLRVENWVRMALPTVVDKAGTGCRLWMPNLPVAIGRQPNFIYHNITGDRLYEMRVMPNGALNVYYNETTLVASTTNPVVAPQSWYHLEFYVEVNTGVYEIRVEGITVLSGTHSGHPTGQSIASAGWYSQGVSIDFYVKDWVNWDTTGSNNNTFIGPVTIYSLTVDSDVSNGWTTSSGSSAYALLDETPPNDADYIQAGSGPLPAACVMGFENLPATVVSVKALQINVRAKKNDGGAAVLKTSAVSGSSTSPGGDKSVTTAFKYWFDIHELDPATGALWSPLAVNSANIKLDRTT